MKFAIGTGLVLAALTSPVLGQMDTEFAPGASLNNEVTPGTAAPEGFGDCIWGPFDVDACSGETGNLGVVTGSNGYHSTTRGLVAPTHMVFVTDDSGTCVAGAEYAQVPGTSASSWGYRDGASSGSKIYFGWEGGLAEHNADGSGGTEIFTGGAPNGVATWRAMAYDPADGGSLWVANFGSNLVRVAISNPGVALDDFPNLDGWSLYGLTLDPQSGNLWGHSWNGEVIEIDTNTGRTTGVSAPGSGTCATAFAAQGGLSGVPGGIGGSGNSWDMVALSQGTPDEIVGMEGHSGGGGFAISSSGSCPGSVTISATGAGAGATVAFAYGMADGSTPVPPCSGLSLDIRSAKLAGVTRANASGNASISGNVPAAACSRVRVQAVDLGACAKSNKLTGL